MKVANVISLLNLIHRDISKQINEAVTRRREQSHLLTKPCPISYIYHTMGTSYHIIDIL